MPKKAPAKRKGVISAKWQVTRKGKSFYQSPPPKPSRASRVESREPKQVGSSRCDDRTAQRAVPTNEFCHPHFIVPAHFTLREDGSIAAGTRDESRETRASEPSTVAPRPSTPPKLVYHDDAAKCGCIMETVWSFWTQSRPNIPKAGSTPFLPTHPIPFQRRHPCHADKRVKVDKGDWNKSARPGIESRIQSGMAATLSARAQSQTAPSG